MSQLTSHYKLIKPEATDKMDPSIFASNFETIDRELYDLKTDYVVAYGTQNGWIYRRWASGFMECYARIAVSFIPMVIVQNGDGGATGVHMQGSTWLGDKCYAVFNNIVNTQTQIRINYLIIYTPSEYFGRNSI